MGDNTKELSFHRYSIDERNHIIEKLSHFIEDEVAPEFTSRGYAYDFKKTIPLKDKKKVPLKYRGLEGFEHDFKLGKTIGSKVEVKFDENKVDKAIIEVSTESHLKNVMIVLFALLFAAVLYAVTIYFWQFWIVVVVVFVVCFCIGILLAILPGLAGLIVGALAGWGLSYLLTPKKSKEANRRDIAFIRKRVLSEARELMMMFPPGTGPTSRPPRQGPPMGRPDRGGSAFDGRRRREGPPPGRRPVREGPPPPDRRRRGERPPPDRRRSREDPPPEGRRRREGPPPDRRPGREGPPPRGGGRVRSSSSDDDFWQDEF